MRQRQPARARGRRLERRGGRGAARSGACRGAPKLGRGHDFGDASTERGGATGRGLVVGGIAARLDLNVRTDTAELGRILAAACGRRYHSFSKGREVAQ
eukprot:4707269-Prymnesium_polylepis.1